MNTATSEVIVETTAGSYRAGVRGPIPVPANEAEFDEVIESLLDIGWRVARENGGTLLRVMSPETGALVEWREEEGR